MSERDGNNFRDDELDALLKPLRDEAAVSPAMLNTWQAAVSSELMSSGPAKAHFFDWRDIVKIAAGVAIGVGIGALVFQKPSSKTQGQENFLASATVHYISAKAND